MLNEEPVILQAVPVVKAKRQRRDPVAKAAEDLRVAENRLEKLATTRADLQAQVDAVAYQMDATRRHVNYLASHPLLQEPIGHSDPVSDQA